MSAPSPTVEHVHVVDLKSCERWLAQAPLADPEQACEQLRAAIVGLASNRRTGERVRLEVLERLREPIREATDEHCKRFIGRALPLRTPEADALKRVLSVFRAQWNAYRDLLEESLGSRPSALSKRAHVLAGRCLAISGDIALAHYRARYDLPAQLWRDLYEIYQRIERDGTALVELPGHGDRAGPTCQALLLRTLLLHVARPFGLTTRELESVRRWIRSWSEFVELSALATDGEALAVDLGADQPPYYQSVSIEAAPATMRALSMPALKRAVQKRVRAIKDGVSPQEIGLGREFAPRDALRLLQHLYNAWFAPPRVRQFTRRAVRQGIDVVAGFAAIHQVFEGATLHRDEELLPTADSWNLLEDSPAGFRIQRPDSGTRLNHLQLIAVRPHGAKRFILTETRWLSWSANETVSAGLQALPGLAQAISARVAVSRDHAEESAQPALLIATSAGEPVQLVVPRGAFLEGCFIELIDDSSIRRVRLGTITRRGSDYECITLDALL